jgi:hypothetical protein
VRRQNWTLLSPSRANETINLLKPTIFFAKLSVVFYKFSPVFGVNQKLWNQPLGIFVVNIAASMAARFSR